MTLSYYVEGSSWSNSCVPTSHGVPMSHGSWHKPAGNHNDAYTGNMLHSLLE